MEARVRIHNNYGGSEARTYCFVTGYPTINDGEIQSSEIHIPVCHKTDKTSFTGDATIDYCEQYYGFLRALKKNRKGKNEIVWLIGFQEPVYLGSPTGNETRLNAKFVYSVSTIAPHANSKKNRFEAFSPSNALKNFSKTEST